MELFFEIETKIITQWICFVENLNFYSLIKNRCKENLNLIGKNIKKPILSFQKNFGLLSLKMKSLMNENLKKFKKFKAKFKKKTYKFFLIRQNLEKIQKKKISKKFSVFIFLFEKFSIKKRSDCEIILELFSFRNNFQNFIFFYFKEKKKTKKFSKNKFSKIKKFRTLFFFFFINKFCKKDIDPFFKLLNFSSLKKKINSLRNIHKKKSDKLFFHFYFNFVAKKKTLFLLKKKRKGGKGEIRVNLFFIYLRIIFEKFNLKIFIIFQTGSLAVFSIGKIFLNSNFNFSKFSKISRFSNKIVYSRIKNFSNLIFKENLNQVLRKFLIFFPIFICPLQKIQNEGILFLFPCCHLFSAHSFIENDSVFFKFYNINKFKKCPCCNFSKKIYNRISFLN